MPRTASIPSLLQQIETTEERLHNLEERLSKTQARLGLLQMRLKTALSSPENASALSVYVKQRQDALKKVSSLIPKDSA